jgi:hypothetical protein
MLMTCGRPRIERMDGCNESILIWLRDSKWYSIGIPYDMTNMLCPFSSFTCRYYERTAVGMVPVGILYASTPGQDHLQPRLSTIDQAGKWV